MRQVLIVVVFAALLGGSLVFAETERGWRDEFDRICAKTGEAGKMNEGELEQLIVESDRLREVIVGSNDPDSKVYLFRIGKCRAFFEFMKDAAINAKRP